MIISKSHIYISCINIMLFFILCIIMVSSETIYETRTSGQCNTPYSKVFEKAVCESQAAVNGWLDTTATSVSFSSYLPQGCIYMTASDQLRIYSRSSSKSCSSDYTCLCAFTAPLCSIGLNEEACICGTNACHHTTGLQCSSDGQCSHPPACSDGKNTESCLCGSTDCTALTGLICSSGVCSHATSCVNDDGTIPNSELCQCGTRDCNDPYCFASQNTCKPACPKGYFRTALLGCNQCTVAGYYCPSGSISSETTFACPTGKWSDTAGISSEADCSVCTAGRYSSETALTSNDQCIECSAGRFSDETGVTSNDGCKGRCSAGKWSTLTGLTSDAQCDGRCSAGKWSAVSGLTSNDQCFGCSAGKWSVAIGLTSDEQCVGRCPVGTKSTQIGLVSSEQCQVCGVNKYQDEIGQTFCKGCPDDKLIADTVSASKHDSVSDCIKAIPVCLATQYLKNDVCTACQEGHVCDGTSMIACPPGSYCDGDGTAKACPTGRYGEKDKQVSEQDACKDCDEGTFQNVPGQTYCARGCPRGTFGNVKGASSQDEACQPCLTGHRCPYTMMNRAEACPLGSYQSNDGSEICSLCPKDTFSDSLGAVKCKDCPSPLRTIGLGSNSQTECIEQTLTCEKGERLSVSNECEKCPKGSYGTENGCSLCPLGTYQPELGQVECLNTSSLRCQHILGCSEESSVMPNTWSSSIQHYDLKPPENKYFVILGSYIAYISLGGIIFAMILTHRCWPSCTKHLDMIFSSDHIVQHKHAKRVIRTRLGAALTLSIPLVVSCIAVFVFTSDNTTVIESLVPMISEQTETYGTLNVEYATESGSSISNCKDIDVQSKMNCTEKVRIKRNYVCVLNISCLCKAPFSGLHELQLTMPDNFQRSVTSVTTSVWNNTVKNITQTLYPENPLGGTRSRPSAIEFDVIRSKLQTTDNVEYGLRLSKRTIAAVESMETSGQHVVSVQFYTADTLFQRTVQTKLEWVTRIGTILTLTISSISAMRVFKLSLGNCIDNCFLKCCKKPPKDVKKRQSILNETKSEIEMKNPIEYSAQILTDEVSGRRYIYDRKTRTSMWLEESTINSPRTNVI